MRIALGVEYDGSGYCGWQSQPQGCAVQDVLESALSRLAEEKISVIAAGRTDTGVHAIEQVIHFDTNAQRPMTAWVRGVNASLPPSISVLWASKVGESFHARFSAEAREYSYFLLCRPVRSALQNGKVGWVHHDLDVQKMRESASFLLGEHDFSAFRASECQAKSPVKHLRSIDIERQEDLIRFDFSANAFLHHMVRNIVGCLVYVGKGKHPPVWVRDVLESRNRSLAAPTFPPDGLYLRKVEYAEGWELPKR